MFMDVDEKKNDLSVSLKDVYAAYKFCRDSVIYLNSLPKEVSDAIWELIKDYLLAKIAGEEIDLTRYNEHDIIEVYPKKEGEDID